ncbi:hypothetical protein [Amycolatopsis sp. NPDC004625]|uniref:hypothetical protein n=1 Tax=Amycolatopsis sp. NPDC004625 TaxID=3154670 RepID=UPI0033B6BC63
MTDYDPATPAPFDMAAINAAIDRKTPEQRATELAEAESVAVGLDAMQLGDEYSARGDLRSAARWYAVAARHEADGAVELLADTEALIDATGTAGMAEAAEDTQFRIDVEADDARRAENLESLSQAASVIHVARAEARRIVDAAHAEAERVLAEVRQESSRREATLQDLAWNVDPERQQTFDYLKRAISVILTGESGDLELIKRDFAERGRRGEVMHVLDMLADSKPSIRGEDRVKMLLKVSDDSRVSLWGQNPFLSNNFMYRGLRSFDMPHGAGVGRIESPELVWLLSHGSPNSDRLRPWISHHQTREVAANNLARLLTSDFEFTRKDQLHEFNVKWSTRCRSSRVLPFAVYAASLGSGVSDEEERRRIERLLLNFGQGGNMEIMTSASDCPVSSVVPDRLGEFVNNWSLSELVNLPLCRERITPGPLTREALSAARAELAAAS